MRAAPGLTGASLVTLLGPHALKADSLRKSKKKAFISQNNSLSCLVSAMLSGEQQIIHTRIFLILKLFYYNEIRNIFPQDINSTIGTSTQRSMSAKREVQLEQQVFQ